MRFLLLLLAPALYAQTPGLVTVQAGVLDCGAVMRAANQIQHYCYGPGGPPFVTIHNALETVYGELIVNYEWCVHEDGCTYVGISWDFRIVPTGIQWQFTTGTTIISGILTQIYGTTAALPKPIPWSGVALNLDGATVPVLLWSHTSCPKRICGPPETCATIQRQGTAAGKAVPGSVAVQGQQVICPLTNVFQVH